MHSTPVREKTLRKRRTIAEPGPCVFFSRNPRDLLPQDVLFRPSLVDAPGLQVSSVFGLATSYVGANPSSMGRDTRANAKRCWWVFGSSELDRHLKCLELDVRRDV